jgi:hypothetical protein
MVDQQALDKAQRKQRVLAIQRYLAAPAYYPPSAASLTTAHATRTPSLPASG